MNKQKLILRKRGKKRENKRLEAHVLGCIHTREMKNRSQNYYNLSKFKKGAKDFPIP